MTYIVIILIILLLFAGYAIYNLIRKNNAISALLQEREDWIIKIYSHVLEMDKELRTIDSRGHFEADDEVGFFFKTLKEMIQYLESLFKIEDETQ